MKAEGPALKQTTAIKVKNTLTQGMYKSMPKTSADYIVFVCPECNVRNKKVMYAAKLQNKETQALVFMCYNCASEVEVLKPT